jgi:glutamate racemase
VVGCGHYHIVGDSLAHNYEKTILMIGIASFVVKIVKQKLKVDDTLP